MYGGPLPRPEELYIDPCTRYDSRGPGRSESLVWHSITFSLPSFWFCLIDIYYEIRKIKYTFFCLLFRCPTPIFSRDSSDICRKYICHMPNTVLLFSENSDTFKVVIIQASHDKHVNPCRQLAHRMLRFLVPQLFFNQGPLESIYTSCLSLLTIVSADTFQRNLAQPFTIVVVLELIRTKVGKIYVA